MLLFAIISMWQPALLWFWITVISMCFAPFIFNPHQFAFMDFFIDYKTFIHWLFSGNTKYQKESWANFVKSSRSRFTGYKSKTVDDISEDSGHDSKKARFWNVFFAELFLPFCVFLFNFTAFSFINAQTGVSDSTPTSAVFRLLLVTFLPIFLNSIVLFLLFWVSLFVVPGLSYCCKDAGAVIAFIAHTFSVLVYLLDFELMWFLQGWNFTRTLILLITCINMHLILFKVFTTIFLTREYKNNKAHLAWWNGKWYNTGMGWSIILQPIREYFVKIMESSYFAADFFLGHFLLFIQTPIILLPFIDYWHTMVLFWMNPRSIIAHKRILTRKQRALRSRIVSKYFSLYFVMLGVLLFMLIAPFFAGDFVSSPQELLEGTLFEGIFQPNNQNNNDTGPNAPSTILTTTPTLPTFRTVA